MTTVDRAGQHRNLIALLIAMISTVVPAMIAWRVPESRARRSAKVRS